MFYPFRKETEHDKIAQELLDKYYPTEMLDEYYKFGYTQALVDFIQGLDRHSSDELSKQDLIDSLKSLGKSDSIEDIFERLMKENDK